jgi:DNA-binding GntR family transcriptional regulator
VNRLRLHFIKNTRFFPHLHKVADDHALLLEALRSRDFEKIETLWIHHIREKDSLLCFA